jgi:hypothetical protein
VNTTHLASSSKLAASERLLSLLESREVLSCFARGYSHKLFRGESRILSLSVGGKEVGR